jgi:hypothetical protein
LCRDRDALPHGSSFLSSWSVSGLHKSIILVYLHHCGALGFSSLQAFSRPYMAGQHIIDFS